MDKNSTAEEPIRPPVNWHLFQAHFTFIIFALIICSIVMATVEIGVVGPIYSATQQQAFSNDRLPFLFVQVTDTHYSSFKHENNERVNKNVEFISNEINPYLIIHSGDMVDASDSNSLLSSFWQSRIDWDLYNLSFKNAGIKEKHQFIEITGNHDIMNVLSFNSSYNYYREYVSDKEIDMYARKYEVNTSFGQYNIVLFNPVTVPFPSALLGCMPYVAREQMDQLESVFNESVPTIFVCHFPREYVRSAKSYKGRDIHDILRYGKLFMAGHLHPTHPVISHIDNYMSVISPALFTVDESMLYTIDNGAINIYVVSPNKKQTIFVTYPQIYKYTSKDSVFNLNDFPLRVVTLGKPEKVTVEIDNVDLGEMDYVSEFFGNKSFFSLNVHVENGKHRMLITDGTTVREMEFYVGPKTKTMYERKLRIHVPIFYFVTTPLITVFYLLMLLPFWKFYPKLLEEFDEYIVDSEKKMNFFKASGLSVLFIFSRYRKVPKFMRYLNIFGLLILFVVPIWIQTVEKKIQCIVFIWGAYMQGHLVKYVVQFWILFLSIFFMQTSIIWGVGIAYESFYLNWLQKLELGFYIFINVIGNIAWVCVSYAAEHPFTYFCSPSTYLFVFVPIFYYIYIWRDKHKIQVEDEEPPDPAAADAAQP